MRLVQKAIDKKWIKPERLIRFYPVFVLLGIKIKISPCRRRVRIEVPLRWYNSNNNGVMFGGLMLLASDPFPALLFELLLPQAKAWNTSHGIRYIRPATSRVTAEVEIHDDDITYFTDVLKEKRTAKKEFSFSFFDKKGREVAKVTQCAFLKKVGN